MIGLSQGGINPISICFQSGKIQIRRCAGDPGGADPYFIPTEKVDSPFADIFAMGRSMQILVNSIENCYSESLISLINWMQSEITNQRPTVRAIMTYINNNISQQRLNQSLAIHSDYARLYQIYSIELYNYQERMRNEKMILDKKFRKLLDMECEFMYSYYRAK